MDTKTLVVGQDVCLESEIYGLDGKVVKVTPEGVEVQTYGSISRRMPSYLLRFDTNGNELDVSRRERLGFGPSPENKFHTVLWQSAPEFQPWHISGTFTERQQTMREQTMHKHQPFIAWWKSATYEQRLALVNKYYTTRLAPPLRANFAPAEDMAKLDDISSDSSLMVALAKEVNMQPSPE